MNPGRLRSVQIMAPERSPVLAAWDLGWKAGKLKGAIAYYMAVDADMERLKVRWDVDEQPPGFFSVHGGVAYVLDTPSVIREPQSPDMFPADLGGSRFRWHEGDFVPNEPWIMMALILPEGYTVTDPSPPPISAKVFKGRLAVYWKPITDNYGSADVEWNLVKADGELCRKPNGSTGYPLGRRLPHRSR
jgi:hypothetical protein